MHHGMRCGAIRAAPSPACIASDTGAGGRIPGHGWKSEKSRSTRDLYRTPMRVSSIILAPR
jgi:hypothetical protein